MPWVAAVVPAVAGALGSAAAGAGSAAASALPAIGSALGSAGSALGSALGSAGSAIGSGLGSAGSAIGGALSEIPGAVGSFGSGVADTLSSLPSSLSSFGGGGEAGILEGLGQTVPQGVELVGPNTPLNAGLGSSMVEQGLMFPQTMTPGTSGLAQGASLPASFGGPSGATQVADTGMLQQAMQAMQGGASGAQQKDSATMDAFSPMSMMEGILDPVSGLLQQPPAPQMDFGFGDRRPIQTADFQMGDRLQSLMRAFQIQ